jgi:hypothetical protein
LIEKRAKGQLDSIHFPSRLNAQLAALPSVVGSADGPPTRQAEEVFHALSERIDAVLARLRAVQQGEVAELNRLLREEAVPLIGVAAGPVSAM